MTFCKYIYITLIILVGTILMGCSDIEFDNPDKGEGIDPNKVSEAILQIEFDVPRAEQRTKSDELGNTDVASLWVGVYDIETGNRVGASFNTSGLNTGKVSVPVIYYDAHPDVVIVGVANYNVYDNIYRDWDDNTIEKCLQEADTWNKFLDINVKCPTTTEGVPAPITDYNQIMMGLLTDPTSDRPFCKKSTGGTVSIDNVSGEVVKLVDSSSSIYGSMIKQVTGRKIYLQRLYSQVNVIIKTEQNAEVTNVSYRRGNIPKAVFLAEHPTYTTATKNWNPWIENTPNFADTKLSPNTVDNPATGDSYYTETSWNKANRDNSFTFYHYENKHWGWLPDNTSLPYGANNDYLNREDIYGNNLVTLLGNGYNVYASYFVIRMTIIDRNTQKSAMVDYVIHEGNCNDAFGNTSNSPDKIYDYCSFRNMVYTYNLTVNGNGLVTYNVESKNDWNYNHHDGNSGIIWTASIGEIIVEGTRDPYGYFYLPPNHNNIVYRFYQGRGNDQDPLDLIYGSFSKEELKNLDGMYWPTIDDKTIVQPTSECNLKQLFWFKYNNDENTKPGWPADYFPFAENNFGTYVICIGPYTKEAQWNPDAYKVGFYFYDPDETTTANGSDTDGCTYYQNKVCHVYEWKPAQKQKERLYLTNSYNLPTDKDIVNFVTQNVVLDFKDVTYRTQSNNNVSRNDYEIHVKINGQDYTLNNDYKCIIPISAFTSNSYSYTVYAKALNTIEFTDSQESTNSNAITFTTPNPYWDFTGTNNWDPNSFEYWYERTFKKSDRFTETGSDNTYEWKYGLSINLNNGSVIGGPVNDGALYFNNSGSSKNIKFKIFKDCTMIIKVMTDKDGDLRVRCSGMNEQSMSLVANQFTTLNIPLMVTENGSEVTIYQNTGSTHTYYYSITLQ